VPVRWLTCFCIKFDVLSSLAAAARDAGEGRDHGWREALRRLAVKRVIAAGRDDLRGVLGLGGHVHLPEDVDAASEATIVQVGITTADAADARELVLLARHVLRDDARRVAYERHCGSSYAAYERAMQAAGAADADDPPLALLEAATASHAAAADKAAMDAMAEASMDEVMGGTQGVVVGYVPAAGNGGTAPADRVVAAVTAAGGERVPGSGQRPSFSMRRGARREERRRAIGRDVQLAEPPATGRAGDDGSSSEDEEFLALRWKRQRGEAAAPTQTATTQTTAAQTGAGHQKRRVTFADEPCEAMHTLPHTLPLPLSALPPD
jgi:hypothetical protein